MAAKPPTPQGISTLLREAGFEPVPASHATPGSGYCATKAYTIPGAVLVSHRRATGNHTNARRVTREMHGKYAEAIRKAGYRAEHDAAERWLIVTAAGE